MVHIVYTKHVTSNWPKSGLVFKSLTSEWQAHDSCFFCYNYIFIFSIIIYLYFKLYYIYMIYIFICTIVIYLFLCIWACVFGSHLVVRG